jgi:hypothetical protein
MVSGNTESGITVTYQDADGTLDFAVTSDPTLTLSGDASGSATFTNLGNATLAVVVADDSHNHVISNVDGLQTALDAKTTPGYVDTQITNLIGGAPGTLDTLNELAAAINDDSAYSSTLTTALATKTAKTSNQSLGSAANVMTISGHTITLARGDSTTDTVTVPDNNTTYSVGDNGLTQKNFTTTLKTKLDGIATSANNYSHPGYAGDDFSVDTGALSGATVVSDIDINVTTDSSGHVTDTNGTVSTRTLTLANLGYTGATNANNYSYPYSVNQSTGTSNNVTFNNVQVNGTLTESSASVYKENISPIGRQLLNIMRLNPVEYDKKSSGDHEYGLIAEEVQKIYPDFVGMKDGKADSLNYSRMVSVLVKAVQELTEKVEKLSK